MPVRRSAHSATARIRHILVAIAAASIVSLPAYGQTPADPAWELYADAFEAYLQHEEADAFRLLKRLEETYPGHPAAARARSLIAQRDRTRVQEEAEAARRRAVAPRDLAGVLRNESTSSLARAELTILQTLNGIAAGVEICSIAQCASSQMTILSAMLGGGLGLGGSLWLTRDGITQGHTLALNSGTAWGAFHGASLTFILDPGPRASPALLLGGQLGGLLVGHLAYETLRPGAGDVSLVNSGGIWGAMFALLVLNATEASVSDAVWWGSILGMADVGMVAAGLLASRMPMSRGRTLVIDAGGIVGLLFGFGVEYLISGKADGAFFAAGAVGMVGGLTAATMLSKEWDLALLPAGTAFHVIPTDGGARLALAGTF